MDDHRQGLDCAEPALMWLGSEHSDAPLVVLLHGRGADERSIAGLGRLVPREAACVAVRAPIAEGDGYAWFANRGIGRPLPQSLRAYMDWFRRWLDSVAARNREVLLVGFSGGAAFAGGLILDDPGRFAGAAILYGTLPFDAGVSTGPARLAGVPVFLAHGDRDAVIPKELLDATWTYLTGPSGAATLAHRDESGHELSPSAIEELASWLSERLRFLRRKPVYSLDRAEWLGGHLPKRQGDRPVVTWQIPQSQQTDQAPVQLQTRLFELITALPGVHSRQSAISVPGARGFMVDPAVDRPDAFLVPAVGEFAHLHPTHDGSLHLALPPRLAADLVRQGWGQAHPLAGVRLTPGMVMLYGPRSADELETVARIVATSHAYATGTLALSGDLA